MGALKVIFWVVAAPRKGVNHHGAREKRMKIGKKGSGGCWSEKCPLVVMVIFQPSPHQAHAPTHTLPLHAKLLLGSPGINERRERRGEREKALLLDK